MKKRKKYLVTADSEALACSLVTNPAVEELFVAFNEEKPLIEKFADEKKHMITGVVAIPNKPIYRRGENGEEYDIVFSEEAIEHMAKSYLREYRQNEVTLQHQEDTEGVYLVEQWLKSDMVYDKSIALGLSRELPIGSWIQTYYVDSNDVWKRIESGELAGFSLECIIGLEEFSKQNDNNMEINETNEMFWDKFKSILKEVFTSASMSKQEELYEDINEQKTEVVETELEEQTPPTPEPTVEPTTEPEPEPTTEPEPVTEPTPEPVVEEPTPEPVDNHLLELVNSLKQEIEALKEVNTGLQEKVKGLEAMPSAKPVNTQAKPSAANTYAQWREVMREMIG